MKKLALLLTLLFVFTACGNQAANNQSKDDTKQEEQKADKQEEQKVDKQEDQTEKKDKPEEKVENTDQRKKVTATTSFLYDMVNQLAGDYVDREIIVPAGEDPHLYVAKSQDTEKLTSADLVLYHGMHFEGKMVDVLEKMGVPVSENFPEDKIGKMDDEGEMIIDPHFWFDLDLYKMATERASEELQKLLPEHATEIKDNTTNYLKKLDELNEYNKGRMAEIPKENRYLITPHDAFNYFSRSYDIGVVAPQGVSTDSEVANKDIEETVNFIVEHKVKAIFAESTTDPARMDKLKESAAAKGFDVKVVSGEGQELFSDSLAPEGEFGDNFIDMYKHNVDLIVDNLK